MNVNLTSSLLYFLLPFDGPAELGHLKCDHGLWLTVANVLAMGTVSLLPIISGAPIRIVTLFKGKLSHARQLAFLAGPAALCSCV